MIKMSLDGIIVDFQRLIIVMADGHFVVFSQSDGRKLHREQ